MKHSCVAWRRQEDTNIKLFRRCTQKEWQANVFLLPDPSHVKILEESHLSSTTDTFRQPGDEMAG